VFALGPLGPPAPRRPAQALDLGFGLGGAQACSEGLGRLSDTGLGRGALGPIGSALSGAVGLAGLFLAPARDLPGSLAACVMLDGALPLDLGGRLADHPALALCRFMTLRESGVGDRPFGLGAVRQAGRPPKLSGPGVVATAFLGQHLVAHQHAERSLHVTLEPFEGAPRQPLVTNVDPDPSRQDLGRSDGPVHLAQTLSNHCSGYLRQFHHVLRGDRAFVGLFCFAPVFFSVASGLLRPGRTTDREVSAVEV
jgi:hypothetical protein